MSTLDRRKFITLAGLGAGMSLLPNRTFGNTVPKNDQNAFLEPSKSIPVSRKYEVVVCGGGPAGVAAAISAARSGAKTLLIEMNACLGGIWTAGLLSWIFDFDKPGLTEEIIKELTQRGAKRGPNTSEFVYEPEGMKLLLEDLCVAAGVDLLYFTQVVAAYKEGRRLTTIVTESKSGRQAWVAPVFIDATGDGDLGYLSGCDWEIGSGGEKDCPCQPLTFNALAVVKNASLLGDYISFYSGRNYDGHVDQTQKFLSEIRRAGINPSYSMPTLFQVKGSILLVMVNHEYGIKPYDMEAMTRATVRARAEVSHIINGLSRLGGVWEGMQMVASAEKIGVREGRRIKGLYVVKREDLIAGARFDDAVTRVGFNADIHAADKETDEKELVSHGGFRTKPYDIPLRALIAIDVDGLMMAGRCISGDFMAHASYRVTGDAVSMGEASGKVAALAVKTSLLPHEVKWSDAKKVLS